MKASYCGEVVLEFTHWLVEIYAMDTVYTTEWFCLKVFYRSLNITHNLFPSNLTQTKTKGRQNHPYTLFEHRIGG